MTKFLYLLLPVLLAAGPATAQTDPPATVNVEISMPRDSARQFFGSYQFEPNFTMRIFSENGKYYGQRVGDPERFQLFAKQANRFFLKAMPAELEFVRDARGRYQTLVLHQGGRNMRAQRTQAQPVELYDTVLHLDSLLYGAYNRRNLPVLLGYFAPTLEFYHDQTGFTTYAENARRFKENFAKPTVMRRELAPGSLEVYPIAGFGAIEIGTHRFYQTDPGQPERLVAEPRFLHVWQNTQGRWQIVRIVSYDH
ncbi:nuclear transport factor 2 family protein [Hymenobacter monticola]|uniref:DUF4440 domain-containing protein n=1 Tax=Hymenobacter monticola TaxID=1705399 RepID=A0ABY4B2M8_9BACT|nr:nuclear transport factor 2 family protein [Hymenobacter monticola]UOE33397.1 DUF4440 domain-containing protein [Hymenobacter monticola]